MLILRFRGLWLVLGCFFWFILWYVDRFIYFWVVFWFSFVCSVSYKVWLGIFYVVFEDFCSIMGRRVGFICSRVCNENKGKIVFLIISSNYKNRY